MKRAKNYSDKGSTIYQLRLKRFLTLMTFMDNIRYRLQKPQLKILDVGGTQLYWETFNHTSKDLVTVMNVVPSEESRHKNITIVQGDATNMAEFDNNEFDVVFSNSVIEHVGDFEAQKRMANEVNRVGKYFFLQTPNFWFPIEPHFRWPLFAIMPYKAKEILFRYVDTRNKRLRKEPLTKAQARHTIEGITLLKRKELSELFPACPLIKEKYLGFVKSFMVHSPLPG